MTWNVSNINKSHYRELQLKNLLDEVQPDVVTLTETELPSSDTTFAVENYTVWYPEPVGDKFRLLLLVRTHLVPISNPTVICRSTQDLWIKLPSGPLALGAVYRQWGKGKKEGMATFLEHVENISSTYNRTATLGDYNLDIGKKDDPNYYRAAMLREHLSGMENHGFSFMGPATNTYSSHGLFMSEGGDYNHRRSTLDHVYTHGLGERVAVAPSPTQPQTTCPWLPQSRCNARTRA